MQAYQIVCIEHIGSTAIKTICAKPIIDILVEAENDTDFKNIEQILVKHAYICMSENEKRISFNKGYSIEGFADRVFHLHLVHKGEHDELYFRDYLQEHMQTAKEYENLKIALCEQYKNDCDAYTNSKTEFIKKYTQIAKELVADIRH